MSAFHAALAEFLRLQRAENAVSTANGSDEEERALEVACEATEVAFSRLFAMPAENGSQAAAKLAAMASFYTVPGCGCDPQGWAMLVAEVTRFSAAAALRGVA